MFDIFLAGLQRHRSEASTSGLGGHATIFNNATYGVSRLTVGTASKRICCRVCSPEMSPCWCVAQLHLFCVFATQAMLAECFSTCFVVMMGSAADMTCVPALICLALHCVSRGAVAAMHESEPAISFTLQLEKILMRSCANLPRICIVASCPGGVASNVVTFLANADLPLSVAMTTVSTLLAVIATPTLTRALVGTLVPVDPAALLMSTLQASHLHGQSDHAVA